MNITEQIQNDIKEAMKAKDREKLTALRDIKSKLLLEMTKDGSGDVDESAGMKILNKLYKQRTEAAAIYQEQGREDLAANELSEAEVIKAYLPEQLSEAEIESKVAAIIADTGASSMADMGKVMGAASQAMAGVADGKIISGIVRKLLA
ncbi:MAG: GatB/YqeY domain-containing protein [Flavobacteriales bacterium]